MFDPLGRDVDCSFGIIPRISSAESGRADPVLAAKISLSNTRLPLAQNRDDLFLRKPRSLHRPVLPSVRTLASSGNFAGLTAAPIRADSVLQDKCTALKVH